MLKKSIAIALISSTTILYSGSALAANIGQPNPATLAKTTTEQAEQAPTLDDRIGNILNPDKAAPTVGNVKAGNVYLPKNTQIELRLMEPLHSKYTREGASITFEVVKNIIVNGVVVIPRGTEVYGTVLKSRKAGGLGRKGKLEIDIPTVPTINGVEIPVNGYIGSDGKTDGGAAAVGLALSVVGSLFMKGSNIHYEPGQIFTVKTKDDTDLEATNDNLAEVMRRDIARGTSIVVAPK